MLANELLFPEHSPKNYGYLSDEPTYDAARHLALEKPTELWTLGDFGYNDEQISECASNIAMTSPFRILSDEGVRVAKETALRLRNTAIQGRSDRVPTHVAGAVYKSRFLRDMCACPQIQSFLCDLSGTKLAPHTLPSQQIYINYTPDDITKAVDAWHYDGIGFDYVLMVSDPKTLKGGYFEYFKGTKNIFAERFKRDVPTLRRGVSAELPSEDVVSVEFPAAGYGVFQQGNMIVHRAGRLLEYAERITMIPGYVALDVSYPDPTAMCDVPRYREPGICAEVARHSAWLAQRKLQSLMEDISLDETPAGVESLLTSAITDVQAALVSIRERIENGSL